MKPHLTKNDESMFYKYLDNAKIYFEYGSGGSTYQASIRNNIIKIYSVESDKEWINTLQQNITSNNITYFYNEMNVLSNTWGHPGPNSTHEQYKNYSNHMRNLTEAEQKSIDFILIDGQHRYEAIKLYLEKDDIQMECNKFVYVNAIKIDNIEKDNEYIIDLFKKINNNKPLTDEDVPSFRITNLIADICKDKILSKVPVT